MPCRSDSQCGQRSKWQYLGPWPCYFAISYPLCRVSREGWWHPLDTWVWPWMPSVNQEAEALPKPPGQPTWRPEPGSHGAVQRSRLPDTPVGHAQNQGVRGPSSLTGRKAEPEAGEVTPGAGTSPPCCSRTPALRQLRRHLAARLREVRVPPLWPLLPGHTQWESPWGVLENPTHSEASRVPARLYRAAGGTDVLGQRVGVAMARKGREEPPAPGVPTSLVWPGRCPAPLVSRMR